MSSENRQSKRVSVPHVLVKVATSERLKSSYLKDLSEGGLFVRAGNPLAVGRQIMVDLLAPNWVAPLRISGVVQRVAGPPSPGMGVKFENNPPEVLQQLKLLLDEYGEGRPQVPAAPDAQLQLQQLLASHSDLQTALQTKIVELEAERSRRDEAQQRLIALAAELEAARAGGGPSEGVSETLKAELQVARAEALELRTAMAERDGELEAYKRELAQLEADETASRRLATLVAREKIDLEAALAQLRATAEEAESRLKLTTSEQQVLRAEAGGLAMQNEALTRDVARLQDEATELSRLQSATHQRLEASEQRAVELQARASNAEAQVALLKGEAASAQRRAAVLEGNLRESNERVQQLKVKERELRELLSAVSTQKASGSASAPAEIPSSSPSVFISNVEMDEPGATAQGEEPAPPAGAPTSSPSIEVASSSAPSVQAARDSGVQFDVDTDEGPEPAAPPASASASASAPASRFDALEDFDVDTEEAASAVPRSPPPAEPGPGQREQLEQRLRQNETLVKTEQFDAIDAPDEAIRSVKGLMEAGGRLSELMVLGRGVVAPPELVRGLTYLLLAGALRFEGSR